MKHLLLLTSLVFFTSFVSISESKTLPNGHYKVALDQKYKDSGMNDFEITINNAEFILHMFGQTDIMELKWISETAFIVPGYTEPKNAKDLPGWVESDDKQAFHITKEEGDTYYFHLGTKEDTYPILMGRLIKMY